MNRELLRSTAYVRAARRYLKKHPQTAVDLERALLLLTDDAFDPRLKSHKLKGDLEGVWACSAGYDLRILFELVQHKSAEAILLLTVGAHDEVY
ncbi:MAG: type II toxin-antitoxin system YafQ family toxin [Planctomycetaceae bacterium]